MQLTDEMVEVVAKLNDLEGKTEAEYDEILTDIIHACKSEHRRITMTDDYKQYHLELARLCREFVTDVYYCCDYEDISSQSRVFLKHCAAVLSKYLRKKLGIVDRRVIYEGEFKEMRIYLLDREACCKAIEDGVGLQSRELLREMRKD